MKKSGLVLIILFVLMSVNVFAQSLLNKSYLRIPDSHWEELNISSIGNSTLKKMNFGLSKKQIEDINDLSKGAVDFRNIYLMNTSDLISSRAADFVTSYGSTHFKPPVEVTDMDPKAKEGWWLQALNVPESWEYATGKGVVIADCDAGYYINESDIHGNLLLNYAMDLADKDQPNKVDDGGYVSHGTSVVAIMAGIHDDQGTNGIAFNSKVVPLQNFNYSSALDDIDKEEATAQCILEAIKIPEVQIIVLENQTSGSSETFEGTREAVKLALMSGVVIVSAGGNSNNELHIEEKYDTDSIIVGAVTPEGAKASFSNYGTRVSIAAYGSDLLTLSGPNGAFGMFGGTSGATPQVAGTVALMLEVNPSLTPKQIKDIFIETRETIPENQMLGGLLNTLRAVQKAKEMSLEVTPRESEHKSFRNQLLKIM